MGAGFIVLAALLAAAFSTRLAAAIPFAYVTNQVSDTVAVIDTATNTKVTTIPLQPGSQPFGVAVTPDGKRAYVTNHGLGTVSVIDTASNTVVGLPIPLSVFPAPSSPFGVAVAPDGKQAYVADRHGSTVAVIDTATNMVGAPIAVEPGPVGVAFTPDGKHAYVTNQQANTVSVIDTTMNMMLGASIGLPPAAGPTGVAVTPDGKQAYVTNGDSNNVSVIDTSTNMLGVPITGPELRHPNQVAVTPDGTHAYVTNGGSGTVSVIDTATNTLAAPIALPAGSVPTTVAIMPPPPRVPFAVFKVRLGILFASTPNQDVFDLRSDFTLSSTTGFILSSTLSSTKSNGIDPLTEPVNLQIGTFTITIPPGSFKWHEHEDEGEDEHEDRVFSFRGVIDGVRLKAVIEQTGTLRYAFRAKARDANLTGTVNPVLVTLTIGDDSGTTSVTARIF